MSEDPITGGRPVAAVELTPSQEAEMERRIEAVRDAVQAGRPERHPAGPVDPVDPVDLHEDRANRAAGRRADPSHVGWRMVMERHGFRWYEPAELTQLVGPERYVPRDLSAAAEELGRMAGDRFLDAVLAGQENQHLWAVRPHRVGQWRNDLHDPMLRRSRRAAFTEQDLIDGFGGPEQFDAWMDLLDRQHRARAAGIVLP